MELVGEDVKGNGDLEAYTCRVAICLSFFKPLDLCATLAPGIVQLPMAASESLMTNSLWGQAESKRWHFFKQIRRGDRIQMCNVILITFSVAVVKGMYLNRSSLRHRYSLRWSPMLWA
ncbi:hypothetical protein Cflav_PD4806 [Pedosphaera parvula Ellin514]|uniref:Uncharacterized protein n=1 Tax=Pedosphaera parvula (strain Ellin514) TaxID=320771 RepID=B9XEQ2_PEDPL|nr:hypothetical protein Cflav_PD4806 [Pedosphaera parvula Ellin514]